ncbi:hypothetical protein G6F70_005538 [Rhizopus microsporus]|uniref:Extracellular membrane protein CFEM domain-containing protein n=2 Tax=Rhizopus TaxID=4842 RepID=A0A367K0H3_RHIAZ|nr:hypothetical protein G6F71_005406 [Rhizopus microsporus]RCH95742.1 hypothetical protein CU097_014319 [Rhizopus azygosporus]KAG1198743.1 hypothetical protein G6F70_005538 [Rhizopus microsporus]KAG1210504.1 hypothetical protein G6F69_005421 [Rhizopus microsporus]KAG1232249.1 hypothetical protein G6F67_005152 [Rhizopus microsporus]
MKFAIVGLMALSLVSAQNVTSDAASSVVVATTTTITPTSTTTSNCAVQSVFDLCLSNQDDYIKRCQPQDYACLCTTNKQKLSCWVNCPNDSGKGTQEGIVQEICSMPGANVSVTPWSSSAAPTSTNIVASSSIPASSSIASATPTKAASGSSALDIGNTAFALIGAAIVYMIF